MFSVLSLANKFLFFFNPQDPLTAGLSKDHDTVSVGEEPANYLTSGAEYALRALLKIYLLA